MRLPCHNHQNRIISGKLWTVHAWLVHAKTQQPNELSSVSERSPQRTATGRVYMILLKIYSLSSIFFTHLHNILPHICAQCIEKQSTKTKTRTKLSCNTQTMCTMYNVQRKLVTNDNVRLNTNTHIRHRNQTKWKIYLYVLYSTCVFAHCASATWSLWTLKSHAPLSNRQSQWEFRIMLYSICCWLSAKPFTRV